MRVEQRKRRSRAAPRTSGKARKDASGHGLGQIRFDGQTAIEARKNARRAWGRAEDFGSIRLYAIDEAGGEHEVFRYPVFGLVGTFDAFATAVIECSGRAVAKRAGLTGSGTESVSSAFAIDREECAGGATMAAREETVWGRMIDIAIYYGEGRGQGVCIDDLCVMVPDDKSLLELRRRIRAVVADFMAYVGDRVRFVDESEPVPLAGPIYDPAESDRQNANSPRAAATAPRAKSRELTHRA